MSVPFFIAHSYFPCSVQYRRQLNEFMDTPLGKGFVVRISIAFILDSVLVSKITGVTCGLCLVFS